MIIGQGIVFMQLNKECPTERMDEVDDITLSIDFENY